MRRQALCNLHCAIESLAADGFVHQSLPFGFTRREGNAPEDVHERGWRSDGAWQPLRAAGSGKESKVRLRQSDQVVAILSDTKIAGERELESTGHVSGSCTALTRSARDSRSGITFDQHEPSAQAPCTRMTLAAFAMTKLPITRYGGAKPIDECYVGVPSAPCRRCHYCQTHRVRCRRRHFRTGIARAPHR